MSRRKQPKPRHIESEDEIASLLQNDTESRSPSNSSNPADDAHVCGKCREEFLGLAEFLAHKKTCSRKRLVLVCNPNESESNLMSEGNLDINYNPKVPKLIDQFDYSCIGSDADEDVDEDDMDNFDDDENEIMDAEDREIANEEIDEDLIKISMMNAAANNMSDGEEEENDDENDGDDNNNEIRQNNFDGISEKFGDGSKLDKDNPHHSAIFPFSQSLPSSNVTLEPMMATRAAVAQFAENNALPSDVNMLQTTLYSLQQQQLVQLQLIHQLQQQIIMGIPPPMIANGTLPLMPPLSSLPSCKPVSRSQENSLEKSTKEKKEVDLSKTEPTPGSNIKSEFESMVMASTSSISPLTGNTAIPSALPLPSNNMMSQSAQPSEFAKLTKLVERSQYVSEDPFFRHKCRLCHKVFGSDSALQIHIRSHTGERPFKCNICGNRFTTRGNLKVHFERHKAKYPHVKMNPHPVPEHLDKLPPMPMMGSPFPSTAPTHLPLPSGIMNSTPPMSIAPMMSSMYSRIGFPPKPDIRASPPEDQRIQSPVSSANSSMTSPAPAISEAPASKSPNVGDAGSPPITSETSSTALASTAESSPSQKFTSPLMSSLPQVTPASSYPLLSPLPSAPPPLTPAVPTGSSSRDSILPSKMIDQDENLEKYMEIDRSSETSKLQQLVDNLENKVSDPNQCVICHRVLSCKSALQMHYRIHTGERPYKCKICRRAFTTKGNLKTHMGVHRMKPPIRMMHQCPVCHKSFTNLLVLQQHIRSHATPPGIPPLPDMTHFNAMHSFPPQMDWPQRPYDLSFRRYPDKELDLSRSSSMFHFRKPENESNDGDGIEEQYGDDEESMDIDEEMNAIKEESEANYKNEENPSGDSGAGSEEGHHSSIDEEEKKETEVERPHSAASEVSRDSGRSASPNSENDHSPATDAAQIYPSLANSGSVSTYNTSLAALEERVRAIDSSMLQSPMNRFNPFMLHGFQPPISNGDHNPLMKSPNMPYGSESGSEGNITGDDESKPGTPALSINSDGGSSIMSGLRDGDKSTTCNICLKAFACRSALDIHYRSHTKERPYKCGACDRSFSTKGNMKQHMLTHKIRDLPNSFNNNSNSSASHENNNSNDSVSEEKKEEGHSRPESTPAANGNNDSGSSRASNGISPNTSNGGDVSPFLRRTPLKHQCQVCQKGFSSASALQIHIRTHTGDKPFKCNVCGKAFTTKGNLKVHMGTHMWNNSPSRRGRRMSIEPPFMLAHKENPYMSGFPHRSTPDFFPFQFPPFMNGVPPHKMNEISVIQSLGGGMGHLPPMSLSSEHLLSPRSKGVDSSESKPDSWRKSDSNGNVTSTGELDLSMKSNPATSPNNNNKRSPTSDTWNSAWKTMCHLCNQNFPSPTALDNHMQNFHLKGGESHSKSLVA